MENQPLISCIVIFFNAGDVFFKEAIESVLAQTYGNWELLLIDDGSSDKSTAIALEYAAAHPEKIHYYEHEDHQNRGMSATRNLGIHHAIGKYVAFLDADDVWVPNTLMDQQAILAANPSAAMVYGPIQWWHSWTNLEADAERDFVEVYVDEALVPTDELVLPPSLFPLLLQGKICISGMLIQRQAIEAVGGYDEAFRGLYEDQVFCAKMCLRFPIFVASQWWYKYRQHPNSCCAIAEKEKTEYWLLNRPDFLNWIEQYLRAQNCQDPDALRVLRQEQWPYRHPILNSLKAFHQKSQWSLLRLFEKTQRIGPKAMRTYWQTRRRIKEALLRKNQ